LTDVTPISILL